MSIETIEKEDDSKSLLKRLRSISPRGRGRRRGRMRFSGYPGAPFKPFPIKPKLSLLDD